MTVLLIDCVVAVNKCSKWIAQQKAFGISAIQSTTSEICETCLTCANVKVATTQ